MSGHGGNTTTDYDPRADLLDAVDALTQPQQAVEWQDDDGKRSIFKRTDPPLLERLRDAIGSNVGGTGAGKPARERAPIDFGAFTTYEDIDGKIRSMMVELGGKVGKDLTPEQVLRAWFTMWTVTRREDHEYETETRKINGWVRRAQDHLDPPPSFEITAPCPLCGAEWVTTGEGDEAESSRALNAVEREHLDDSYALCKACDMVWRGVGMMRRLRIAIDDAETARMEGLTA